MIGYFLGRRWREQIEDRLAMALGRVSIAESRLQDVRRELAILSGQLDSLTTRVDRVEAEVVENRGLAQGVVEEEGQELELRLHGPDAQVIKWDDARERLGLGDASPPAESGGGGE